MLFSVGEGVGAAGVEVSEALHRSSPQNLHCLKKRPLKKIIIL